MRVVGFFLLVLFSLSFVYATDASIDCPDSVAVGEEFTCSVEASGLDGDYDVKVYIRGDSGMINRIWVDGGWQRTDWYAKELLKDGNNKIDVKLKIDKKFSGTASGDFKLRKSGATSAAFSKGFTIDVGGSNVVIDENVEVDSLPRDVDSSVDVAEPISLNSPQREVISLNSAGVEDEKVVVYESKDRKVLNYAPYAFSVFLVIVLSVVFWRG